MSAREVINIRFGCRRLGVINDAKKPPITFETVTRHITSTGLTNQLRRSRSRTPLCAVWVDFMTSNRWEMRAHFKCQPSDDQPKRKMKTHWKKTTAAPKPRPKQQRSPFKLCSSCVRCDHPDDSCIESRDKIKTTYLFFTVTRRQRADCWCVENRNTQNEKRNKETIEAFKSNRYNSLN